jgi:predicted ATPase
MDVELQPERLTVLIGPNGSGKSNVIDALRFVDAFAWRGRKLGDEVESRGGWEELIWGGESNSDLRIELDWQRDSDLPASYATTIRGTGNGAAVSVAESVAANGTSLIERRKEGVFVRDAKIGHPGGAFSVAHFGFSKHIVPERVGCRLPDWGFYGLTPSATRGPKPIRREYRLDETGGNLATVIHTLFSDGSPALADAVEILKACVPTVERLISPIHGDGQTYVALQERSVPRPIGSWGLSDGTLLALSLAVALVTPKPPDLICLESPEADIHPRMLEAVAHMLMSASADTQVIVATHSPHLLRWLPYEDFVVVEKERGCTTLRPLRREDQLRELGAGEAWYSGYLGGVP